MFAISWDDASRTAVVAFRGTASSAAWVQNFEQNLALASTTPLLHAMFPEARVHTGFLEQFQAKEPARGARLVDGGGGGAASLGRGH